jgi:serine/threonine protein kinase
MVQVSSGCAYLHDNGIVHRDLKPGNVLLTEKGKAKICDFGQSKDYSEGANENEMTANIGTPVYCAPEVQSDSRVSHYSTKIDVFSFGIIVWSLYTKKRPYNDAAQTSNWALLAAIINGLRPTIPAGMPPRLQALMVACWDAKPELRPSFPEIIARLDSHLFDLRSRTRAHSSARDPDDVNPSGAGAGGGASADGDGEMTKSRATLVNPLFDHLTKPRGSVLEAQKAVESLQRGDTRREYDDNYEKLEVAELKSKCEELGIELTNIPIAGKQTNPIKADIIAALRAASAWS